MNEHGQTETEIEIANAFDASERYSEFGDYYARVSLSGELIGPYDSSDSRDDDLRESISEWLAAMPACLYLSDGYVDAIHDSWQWVEDKIREEEALLNL